MPELFILEEIELSTNGYHTFAVCAGPERDWSEPYRKSSDVEYRFRVVRVELPEVRVSETTVLKRLEEMRNSNRPSARYVARTLLPGRDDGAACLHMRARRGPGSAYAWVACADCGKSLGLTVPSKVIEARRGGPHFDEGSLREALEWEQYAARGCKIEELGKMPTTQSEDPNEKVCHPRHYNQSPSGIECIELIEHLPCNLANAVKYLWRAGLKQSETPLRDLESAKWYTERERQRIDLYELEGEPCPKTDVMWRALARKVIATDGNSTLADYLDGLLNGDFMEMIASLKHAISELEPK